MIFRGLRGGKRFLLITLTGICVLLFNPLTTNTYAQVVINEFMALNTTTYPDMWDFDDFTDWIELYNTGDEEVSLDGYFLTDNLKRPQKWLFPSDAKIPAKGFLVVRADGMDNKPGARVVRNQYPWTDTFTTKFYHTNFKLDDLSEEIGLYQATGKAIDSVFFSRQVMDVAWGRNPADNMRWYKYDTPTPGAANTTTPKPLETIQSSPGPAFSIPGGFFSGPVTVTLLVPAAGFGTYVTDHTEIYYTTDGSIPRQNTAKKYAEPITLNSTTIIRARCFDPGFIAGKVVTNTYFINEKKRSLMCVSMAADSAFLFDSTIGVFANSLKSREIPVSLEFFTTDGKQVANVKAGITLGSLTNFTAPQKPIQIALKGGKYGDDFIWYQFFAKRAACYPKLRLRQGGDAWNTNLIADGMLEAIVNGQLELGMQAYRPVVLFINGNYYGVQDMREQFDDQYFTNNYNLDPTTKEEVKSTFLPIAPGNIEGWALESGTWANYNSLISLVKTGEMTDEKYKQVKEQVNINSFIDFISAIVYGDQISWGHNEDLWKVNVTKWQWLITDFDRAMVYQDDLTGVAHNMFTEGKGVSGPLLRQDTLFANLIKNVQFKNYFCQRFAAHLNSTFKPKRIRGILDSLQAMVTPEMAEYTAKWGPSGGIKSVNAWKATLDSVKMFINERGGYVMQHLQDSSIGMSGTAKLTVTLSTPKAGEIFINGVHMSQGLDTMQFFKSAPFQVKAVANPGYVFTGWGDGPTTDTQTVALSEDKTMTAKFEVSQDHPLPLSITKDTTLILTDKPYVASGDVEVAAGATLSIEKGVTIAMAKDAGIYVKGRLLVNGAAEAPVTIKADDAAGAETWGALCFDTAQDTNKLIYLTVTGPTLGRDALNQRAAINGNATPKVIIDHLYMPDADYPMYFEGCDVALTNSKIIINHMCNGGIHVGRGPTLVENNVWISTGKTMNTDAIDIKGVENGIVRGNRLYNFNGINSDGIDLGESCKSILIEGNFVYGNRDKGVSCGGKSTCVMRNNIIAECDMGIGIKDDGSYAIIDHNTFVRVNKGVNVYEKSYARGGGVSTVRNTIFSGCKIASVMSDRQSSVVVSYSCSDMDIIPGDGNLLRTPNFIDPARNNFQLADNSPCIGSGDPSGPSFVPGSRNIGPNYTYNENDFPKELAAQFATTIMINEIMYNDNPAFNSGDWLELFNPTDKEIDISSWRLTDKDIPNQPNWTTVPALPTDTLNDINGVYIDTSVFLDSGNIFFIPAGTKIAAGGYLVICRDVNDFSAAYSNVSNCLTDTLPFKIGAGERISLYNDKDSLIAFVTPNTRVPWPAQADGGGASLELRNPDFYNYFAYNWGPSAVVGGTPGKQNSIFNTFAINNKKVLLPDRYFLAQNYPNPCKNRTTIVFSLPFTDHVRINIFSLTGRKIETLVDADMKPGIHRVTWDARKYSSGVYLYRMRTNTFTKIMKASVR